MEISASGWVAIGTIILVVLALVEGNGWSRGWDEGWAEAKAFFGSKQSSRLCPRKRGGDKELAAPHKTGGNVASRLKERAELAASLEAEFAADLAAELAAFDDMNPSAFDLGEGVTYEAIGKKAVVATRRHLRRFPNTDCALAWSLKGIITGTGTGYVK